MHRPKIKIELDSSDYVLEAFGGVMILLLILWPTIHYSDLPAEIPMHFNAAGEADGFGSRNSIWVLPVTGLVMYIGLVALNRFPHIFNYPTEITEENAKKQYRNATKLVRTLNVLVAASFLYIEYSTVQTALNRQEGLGIWFLPVFLGGTFLTIGIYLYQSFKRS